MNCWVLPVEVTINFSLVQTVHCLCEILPRNRHIFLSITAWLYFNKLFSHLTPPARDSDNNVGNNPRCWPNTCQGLRSVSTDFSRVWDQSLVWTSQKASSGDAEQNYFSGDAAEAEGKENVADLGATDITQTSRCTGPMVAPGHRSPPAARQGEQFANMHCVHDLRVAGTPQVSSTGRGIFTHRHWASAGLKTQWEPTVTESVWVVGKTGGW